MQAAHGLQAAYVQVLSGHLALLMTARSRNTSLHAPESGLAGRGVRAEWSETVPRARLLKEPFRRLFSSPNTKLVWIKHNGSNIHSTLCQCLELNTGYRNEEIIHGSDRPRLRVPATHLNIKIKRINSEKNMATLSMVRNMTNSWRRRLGRKRTSLRMRSSRKVRSTLSPEEPSRSPMHCCHSSTTLQAHRRPQTLQLLRFFFNFYLKLKI